MGYRFTLAANSQLSTVSEHRASQPWLRAFIVGLVAFFALLMGPASPALAHDELANVDVQVGTSGEASAITLSYTNNIMAGATIVNVTNEAGADVTNGDAVIDGMDVNQALQPLEPGVYQAVWSVVSSDGHRIEGGFEFDVVEGATEPPAIRTITSVAGAEALADTDDATEGTSGGAVWLWISIAIAGVLVIGGGVAAFAMKAKRNATPEDADNGVSELE